MRVASQVAMDRLKHAGAAAPIFKWAGGKRWLIPLCGPAIRAYLAKTGGRYIEPFFGGGALGLWLGERGALVGDSAQPLVAAYTVIREAPGEVAAALARLVARGTDRARYLVVRARAPRRPIEAAARLLFLNRLAYNGLYRTNAAGGFNVPYGRYGRPTFPDADALAHVARALSSARLHAGDFEPLVLAAGPGDVVFADPPYLETFGSYSGGHFSLADHQRLAMALARAATRGAAVLSTNADHSPIRDLYAWATIVPTSERRAVGATRAGRARARCLLITTHSSLIWPETP